MLSVLLQPPINFRTFLTVHKIKLRGVSWK